MNAKKSLFFLCFLKGALGLSSVALGDPYIASVDFEPEVTALDEPEVVVTTGLGVHSVYIDWTQDDTRVRLSLNGGPSSSRWEGTLPANHAGIARFVACAEDESGNTARYLERSYLILENTSSPAGLSNMRYPSMKKWGVSGTTLDADWYGANYTRDTNSTPQIITLKGPTIPDSAVVNSSGTVQNGTGMIRSDKFADGVGSIWFKAKLSTTNSPTGNLRIVKLTTNNGTGARRRWFIHELASVDVPPASDFYEWHQFHLILQDIADIGDSSKCADGMAHYVIYNNTQNCNIDLQDIVLTPIIPDVKIYKDELDYAPAFPSVLDPIEFHIAASNVFAAASASNFTPRLHWRQGDRAPWNETLMTNVLGRTRQGDGGYACILFPGEEGFSDGPFEYFYTVDFTGYTPTFPAIKNNQSPLLNHVVNERFDGNEHPYLIHTNALALLTDADGNISECRSPAVCPTFADVFETTGADAFHDYATSDDVVPDTPATNGVWDLTRKFDLQNLDEGWPCATANRTVYHSYATTIEPDCVEIEGDYQYLTFCAKDGIRRFWSMYTGLTAVTEDHPDAAAPSNLEPAYPMQLVGDYTWQAIVRVTNAIDVVFSATGLNTDGAPVVWMEVDQPADAIQPPTSGILSINPGPDGVLGTRIQADYDGFLMFRFCTTNGAYQIRRAAWQDFNEWQSDDAWYSHSFGLDGVRTFEADLAGMATTAFAANLETRAFDELAAQWVPSFYPGGATPEWDEFDTQSLSGDEGPALAGSNARLLRERVPPDSEGQTSTNRNGALVLQAYPNQTGEIRTTDVSGNAGRGTLSMRVRSHTDDDRNIVYASGDSDTWSNYRVMARIMEPSTDQVSDGEHSLSLIGYWKDPNNYWEARIIQKSELMADQKGRTRNWFEVHLYQWRDGERIEYFGRIRANYYGGDSNYNASNARYPTWPGWNSTNNVGNVNQRGYWRQGQDSDYGLFTLDRNGQWCFVFDLKTEGDAVTPMVWAFRSNDIKDGRCENCTLENALNNSQSGYYFLYMFSPISSWDGASTSGRPGFNMRDCGLKIAPYVFGVGESVRLDGSMNGAFRGVSTADSSSWYHSNDAAYDSNHKIDVWTMTSGNYNLATNPTTLTRPAPTVFYRVDADRTGCEDAEAGRVADWDESWDSIHGHAGDGVRSVSSWKWEDVEIPMNLWDDTFLRIRTLPDDGAGNPSCGSLAVDSLSCDDWRGKTIRIPENADEGTGWTANYAAIVPDGRTGRKLELDRSRANPEPARPIDKQGVISPWMANGIGDVSFSYTLAKAPVRIVVGTVDAAGAFASRWAGMLEPTDEEDSFYAFLGTNIAGRVCVLVEDENDASRTNGRLGTLYITDFRATDYPRPDSTAWEGYNILVSSFSSNPALLPDKFDGTSDAARSKRSAVLNDGWSNGTLDDQTFDEHVPFLSSPSIPTGLGEVSFWYRASPDNGGAPARIRLLVSVAGWMSDDTWRELTEDDLAWDRERYDKASDDPEYQAQRLALQSLSSISTTEWTFFRVQFSVPGACSLRIAGSAEGGTNRVMIDNVLVTEPDPLPVASSAALYSSSEYGTCFPIDGMSVFETGSLIEAIVLPPEPEAGMRPVCIGWKGSGSVPVAGTGTNVAFRIERNSAIAWQWRRDFRISVGVSGFGSCDFASGWIPEGDCVTATIIPSTEPCNILLSGDTNGVMLAGTTLTIPSDRPREIGVVVEAVNRLLDVSTAHGTPTPAAGTTTWSWGDSVTAGVTADAPVDGIRYVCTGWTGTGSVPASGTGANVTFTIEEDSSLTWNWRKENQIAVSVAGCGSCDFGTQWIEDGTTVTATITPTTHLYAISMSGDTNGVTLSGTTLTIPGDGPRNITVTVAETKLALDVTSSHGAATPTTGTTKWSWGDEVTARISADIPEDGVRYVCTGWTGTGSVPASGTGTNVTFTIEEDSALAWNWQKENQISVSVTGCGECNFGTQWIPDGTTSTATIVPTTRLYSISMSGDTNGVTLAGTTLTIPSDGPRNIAVTVSETKLTLDVTSAHGTAEPAVGTTEWSWGKMVSASVVEPEPTNGWNFDCTGWFGTGSVPEIGTGTNVAFTIDEDSSIVWNWATNVWIDCSATGFASIAFEPCWTNFGETVVIPFEPKDIGFSWTATGDTDDIVVDATARTISVPADRPRTIRIAFSGTTRADAASGGGKPVEWTHGGDAEWFVDFTDENDESGFLRSGEIGCGSNSWTEISVTGPGRLDFDWRVSCNSRGHYAQVLVGKTQWKRITGTTDWSSETIEIGEGNHRIRWNYVKGTTSLAGEDRACLDNVVWRPYVTLEVASGIDRCEPTVGEYRRLWGDELVMSAEPAVIHTNERVVCTGWTGTGSAPTTGTGTIAAFTITEDSTLQWNWGREVWIELAAEGPVQIAFTNGWIAQGSSNEVIVAETADYISWSMMVEDLETSDLYGLGAFSGWTNGPNAISPDKESSVLVDTNSVHAVRFDTESGRLSFICHSGCRIALVADEMTLATALDTHGLVWASEGNGKWFPQVAVSSDDEDAAKSGTVQGDDASVLRTTVTGPGTLSWSWKLAMEGSAGVDVFLDDAPVDGLYDACDWTDHALEITGAGEHEVRFEFWNAGDAETITDCAYLDRMKWNGGMFEGMTETTPVPVPYVWLNGYPDLLDLFLHDYEATAWSGAANGANEVWQCYVAGLDPTSAASRLVATIDMVDGEPVVRWTPDLNEGGTKAERVYTVEGKTNLGDGSWGPTNEASRFFRVKVEMP